MHRIRKFLGPVRPSQAGLNAESAISWSRLSYCHLSPQCRRGAENRFQVEGTENFEGLTVELGYSIQGNHRKDFFGLLRAIATAGAKTNTSSPGLPLRHRYLYPTYVTVMNPKDMGC